MKAVDFDKQFEDDIDISSLLDVSKSKRVLQTQKRVNVSLPLLMIESIDHETAKLGVTRQSIIKVWLTTKHLEKSGIAHIFMRRNK